MKFLEFAKRQVKERVAQIFAALMLLPSFGWSAGTTNLIGAVRDVLDVVALLAAMVLLGKAYWGSTDTEQRGQAFNNALMGLGRLMIAYILFAIVLQVAAKWGGSAGLKSAASSFK